MTPSAFLPILGPVLAATIAGGVAFLASVFSKEQTTSEFRQAWIDALRTDLSNIIGIALLLGDEILFRYEQGQGAQAIHKHVDARASDILRLEECKARVRLRLNPSEHRVLLGAIDAMTEPGDHDTKADNLIAESQKVLKAEWRRVKRGEPIFVVTKWISFLLFLGALGIAIALISSTIEVAFVP